MLVFRCSVYNWLLFVVEPLAVFPAVCVCVYLCVFVCIHKAVCVCMHAWRSLCVCACVRSGCFAPRQMCQCGVWSPVRLFHVIVPPTVWVLPSSLLISPSRQPPSSPLVPHPIFPPSSLCTLFIDSPPSFPSVLQYQWVIPRCELNGYFKMINTSLQGAM